MNDPVASRTRAKLLWAQFDGGDGLVSLFTVATFDGKAAPCHCEGVARFPRRASAGTAARWKAWTYVDFPAEEQAMIVTKGFKGRGRNGVADRNRVPPGQFVTAEFPVLTAGPTQHMPLADWSMTLEHDGRTLACWTWQEFERLPQTDRTTDIHCVTKWTKLDTRWRGVTVDDLLSAAGLTSPPDLFAIAHCDGGYTTNLPVSELLGGKAMIATHYEDLPLSASHGGPARLLVPHLYLWKSAKWVRKLRFVARDKPGFWESLGYHNFGDPWREQRYTGDS